MSGLGNHVTASQLHATAKSSATVPQLHRFDPNFTQHVIDATGSKSSPRMRKIMTSLIQHLHDFARENEVTVEEFVAGIEFVS